LLEPVLKQAKLEPLNLPEGVRVTRRGNTNYLLNFNPSDVSLSVKGFPKKIAKHDVFVDKTKG
jgi:hypothetical protein